MATNLFEHVRELENTSDLLQFKVPGYDFLLWPIIRYPVFNRCLYQSGIEELGVSGKTDPPPSALAKYAGLLAALPRFFRPWPSRQTTTAIYLDRKEEAFYRQWQGKLYNPYIEPFAEALPSATAILDNSPGPRLLPLDKPYHIRGIRHATLVAAKLKRLRDKRACSKDFYRFWDFVRARIKAVLHFDLPEPFYKRLEERTTDFACNYTVAEYHVFKKYLKKLRPGLLLVDEALYGNKGHLMVLARELGITTADIQHGAIFSSHANYTWSDALVADERFRAQYPDYFLTYGQFWHSQIRLPGTEPVPIGNPWFSMQVEGREKSEAAQNAVLFTLGALYDEYIPFVRALRHAIPKNTPLVLRPHPLVDISKYALFREAGISVDTSPTIYDAFDMADVVIGDISTGLFEAAALGKRVFSYAITQSDGAPIPFEKFTTPEELVEKVLSSDAGVISSSLREAFFAADWKNNYIHFISSLPQKI